MLTSEDTSFWSKKSRRAIEPVILAKKVSDDWLQSKVAVTRYHFTGALQQALTDLLEVSRRNSRSGTNLPTISLRLMLQIGMHDVLTVDRYLGCGAADAESGLNFAVETLGDEESTQLLAKILSEWAMSSLEPWSMNKGCAEIAMRVKRAATVGNIQRRQSQVSLRDEKSKRVRFSLISRLLADQLRGQELFEGLGACEFVLPGAFNDATFELMSRPQTLTAQPGQGAHTYSMVARVHVSTMPCTDAIFVSVYPSKRVWSAKMPSGGNTAKRATAYAFAPSVSGNPQFRAIAPLTVEKRTNSNEVKWEINGDEHAVVIAQAAITQSDTPKSLESALNEVAMDPASWWIGLAQATRLFNRVDQHTPTDTDETDLLERCTDLWAGMISDSIAFESRAMSRANPSFTAMIKAEDCGTAGAAIAEDDSLEIADEDDDEDESPVSRSDQTKIAKFQEQCVRVLKNVYGEARPTLWLLDGTLDEVAITRKIAEILFADTVDFRRDPLPENVHGLRRDLPGSDLKSKMRFNLRVKSWTDAANTGGLLDAIAAHPGPKFVLICAGKEIGNQTEDSVNRRAAIHAICKYTKAAVHHVLPMENGDTGSRQAKARQNFIHRMQSAMTDVCLAHSGHLINASAFARNHVPVSCQAIYGVQALRKRAQMFSGETPVSMLVYTRINLSTNTTEVRFHYGVGTRNATSQWMPLSEGLIWLAGQRDITSDESWLKDNFEPQTRALLDTISQSDPKAVVLLDWGTLAGLWKALSDESLRNAPTLGQLRLEQMFPDMSFVRVRYGLNAKINVRGKSTTYYEEVRYGPEGTTKTFTGNTYLDEYITTTQRLIEITERGSDAYRVNHFIGVMTPRKTSQSKRGLSCFHSVSRLSKKGDIFERGLRSPQSKDISSPGPIDISVLQCNDQISPLDLATLTMGLRLGYPHYDEWTVLPAPLFFLRKIDDYIIKYPSGEDESALEATDLGTSVDPDDSQELGATSVCEAFEAVSVVIQSELKFEVEDHQPTIKELVEQAPSQATEESNASAQTPVRTTDTDAAAEKKVFPLPVDNQWDVDSLLGAAKSTKYTALIPYSGSDGLRKRQLLNAMIRGDASVTVEAPFFADLPTIFKGYTSVDKKRLSRHWQRLRESGVVRPNAQMPNDLILWLSKRMNSPQGAYATNSRQLFGKALILPQLERIIVEFNAGASDPNQKIYFDDARPRLELSAVTKKACQDNDDETLSWLVFAAAQCPAFGICETVIENISHVPGIRTQAALAYFLQCAYAVDNALAQVKGTSTFTTTSVAAIHLKRPRQFFIEVSEPEPSQIAQAVQSAYGVAATSETAFSEVTRLLATTHAPPIPPTRVLSNEVESASIELAINPSNLDPVMSIKVSISQILMSLEPGNAKFAAELAEIRDLLEKLENVDSERRDALLRANEQVELCSSARAKAQELLNRILAIDDGDIVKASTYLVRDITIETLHKAKLELEALEANLFNAEQTDKRILAHSHADSAETDKRRHARILSALVVELEEQLEKIQKDIWSGSIYTNEIGDDTPTPPEPPIPHPKTMELQATSSGEGTTRSETNPTQASFSAFVTDLPTQRPVEESLQAKAQPQDASQQHDAALVPVEPAHFDINTQESEPLGSNLKSEEAISPSGLEEEAATTQTTPMAPASDAQRDSDRQRSPTLENKKYDKVLSKLRTLIDQRLYGLASIYISAMNEACRDHEEIDRDCTLLRAIVAELEAIDCNSSPKSHLGPHQSLVFDGTMHGDLDRISQAVGIFGVGLSSAIFFDPMSGTSDPLWAIHSLIEQSLQGCPALSALLNHIASREKHGITLSQPKLVMSFASSEDRISSELANYRTRAKNWKNDSSMHTKWSHTGFSKAHDAIYNESSPLGKCMTHIAKDDVRSLKAAVQDFSSKMRKPKVIVEDAFRKIKDKTELNGGYLVHSINNIQRTESFINEYIELSERKNQSGKNSPINDHEREYIKTLLSTLKEACVEVEEIINSGETRTTIENIWLHAGHTLLTAVLRLFADTKADACIPSEIQCLLIQQPMGSDLVPSFAPMAGQPALLQASDVLASIEDLLDDELTDYPQPLNAETTDLLLESALQKHINTNRFLPAWRIDAMLSKPKGRLPSDTTPSLLNLYVRACTDLRRDLQELRQRVTHAMALNALGQKDANRMLHTINIIEAVVKPNHLGKPDCPSPSFPDFPHARFVINETITKVLDKHMQDATQKLSGDLQRLRELKGQDVYKDAERIEAMLATRKPADLRAAYDAMRILERGHKLPSPTVQPAQNTAVQFEEMIQTLGLAHRSKGSAIESLVDLLLDESTVPAHPLVAHLQPQERTEAATFIRQWILMSTLRRDDAAQIAKDMFTNMGLGTPTYVIEQGTRSTDPVRLEFASAPFSSISTDCFIPPQLGSQQRNLPMFVIHGHRSDNEIATLIRELAHSPAIIMGRSAKNLQQRMKAIDRNASVILIDDYLIAFIALHPQERAQKMLEIGLLTFHTNPYSADGAHVAPEMFFGRQREIQTLRNVNNSVVVYGGRRLGKSSLLVRIANEKSPGKSSLYIPMNKDYAGDDHVLFAWKSIYEHLVTYKIIGSIPHAADTAQKYADWIESSLRTGSTKECYLLLDEADELMAAELALPADRSGFVRTLQNVSESLAPHGVRLRYCIAGLHNLARMTTEVNSALGKAETIALEPFSTPEDVMRGIELITKPMAALGFYFSESSADLPLRIMSVCNFYPAFIQIYCRRLLDYMYNKRSNRIAESVIRIEDIERMENDDDLLADLSKKFSMTLDLDSRYKAIALILADHYYREIENGTNEGATLQEIREMCEIFVGNHFSNINTSAYESLLDEMRKLNVLDKSGNKYLLRNPGIAMLLGDKERIESQIQDLANLKPPSSRNHGEKRIPLRPNERSKTLDGTIYFPTPVSWIHSQIAVRRNNGAQLDGSLPILCGNSQSGIQEISVPKLSGKLTEFDQYFCYPADFSQMLSFLRTKACEQLIPSNGGNLLLLSPSLAWKASEISSFMGLAARNASRNIQIALAGTPKRMWEVVNAMRDGNKDAKKWMDCITPVLPYSLDALRFHLNDNRAVADNKLACESILYATCGFGRLIHKHCNDTLTIEQAQELRSTAEATFGQSRDSFYDKVGIDGFITNSHLREIESAILLMDGNTRQSATIDMVVEIANEGKNSPVVDELDIRFMLWMGLLQEASDGTWQVPPLYRRLIEGQPK